MSKTTPQSTLARKERMGVSYPTLADLVGVSHVTVQRVLKEQESGIEINREDILARVNVALDRIESEEATKAA